MKREEYIKSLATELYRMRKRRDNLSGKDLMEMTPKAAQKHNADLNWLGMEMSKTEERIGFAMGFLTLDDLREYYEPSAWHKYEGVRKEMENLKLE